MFPSPNEAARKALDLGRREVFQTYRVLMKCELRRLRPLVERLPAGAGRNEATTRLDEVDAILTGAAWEKKIEIRGATVARAAVLFEEVQGRLDAVAPAVGPEPTVVGNANLIAAVAVLKDRIVDVMSDPGKPTYGAVNEAFVRLFGSATVPVAKARFAQTVTALQDLLKRTDGQRSGFVYEPSMPAGMAAYAIGQGAGGVIRVGRSALDGSTAPWELAATLAHEGTHILAENATVDIVYRQHNAPYYLQGPVALWNAANFEQTVREVLGHDPAPTESEVIAMRGRESRLGLLRVVLTSRIVRAWVRTADFTGLDHVRNTLPPSVAGVLSDLPNDPAYAPPLIKAYIDALYHAMLAVMRADGKLVLREVKDMQRYSTVYNLDGTIRFTVNPDFAANAPVADILYGMLDALATGAQCQIPKDTTELLRFVLEIEKHDRAHLHSVLNDFYSSID